MEGLAENLGVYCSIDIQWEHILIYLVATLKKKVKAKWVNVHGCLICDSPQMETTPVFVNRRWIKKLEYGHRWNATW